MGFQRGTNLKVDLHCHTTASDGALSPTELVDRAAAAGVNLLAITDHDTVKGVAEAQLCAKKYDITIIPGIELSCRWANKQDVHMVGLGVDPLNPKFIERLATQELTRQERGRKIVEKLNRLGFEGADEWLAQRGIITPGRPHFAKFLIEKGAVSKDSEAFKKYLAIGKPAYVPTEWCSIETGVKWIAEAGGVAVIAHPGKYKMTHTKLRRLVECFASVGGHAIEVISGSTNRDVVNRIAALAMDYGLKASVGSDFHRPGEVWQELGKTGTLPSTCDAIWDRWVLAIE